MTTLIDEVRMARQLPPPQRAKAIREAAGVTQRRFAAELGIHRVSLARWEDGSRRPRGDLLIRYTALLVALRTEISAEVRAS